MADYTSFFTGAQIDEGVSMGLAVGDINNLTTEDKTSIVAAINSLRTKAVGRHLYSSSQLVTIKGDTQQEMLSDDADVTTPFAKVIPPALLKKNKHFRINTKVGFSCAAGQTGNIVFKLDSTEILNTNITFPDNKSDYYLELDLFFGIRTAGVNGSVISQGQALLQKTADGELSTLLLPITAPIAFDTTSDKAVSVLFTWGASDPANNLKVAMSTIEVI